MNLEYIIASIVCITVIASILIWIRWKEWSDYRNDLNWVQDIMRRSDEDQAQLNIDLKKLADQEKDRNERIKEIHVRMVDEQQAK